MRIAKNKANSFFKYIWYTWCISLYKYWRFLGGSAKFANYLFLQTIKDIKSVVEPYWFVQHINCPLLPSQFSDVCLAWVLHLSGISPPSKMYSYSAVKLYKSLQILVAKGKSLVFLQYFMVMDAQHFGVQGGVQCGCSSSTGYSDIGVISTAVFFCVSPYWIVSVVSIENSNCAPKLILYFISAIVIVLLYPHFYHMKWQCLLEKNMLNRWRNRSGHRCFSTRACQFQWHPVEELAPWRLRKFLGETMNCGKITGISWEHTILQVHNL